jgi:hypothetical protein
VRRGERERSVEVKEDQMKFSPTKARGSIKLVPRPSMLSQLRPLVGMCISYSLL